MTDPFEPKSLNPEELAAHRAAISTAIDRAITGMLAEVDRQAARGDFPDYSVAVRKIMLRAGLEAMRALVMSDASPAGVLAAFEGACADMIASMVGTLGTNLDVDRVDLAQAFMADLQKIVLTRLSDPDPTLRVKVYDGAKH